MAKITHYDFYLKKKIIVERLHNIKNSQQKNP